VSTPVFGSPQLNDATALIEGRLEKAKEKFMETVRVKLPEMINRPLGTVPVSKEAQQEDFERIRFDVPALQEKIMQFRQQYGDDMGDSEFVKWAEKHLENDGSAS
jgi:hypothetical protein